MSTKKWIGVLAAAVALAATSTAAATGSLSGLPLIDAPGPGEPVAQAVNPATADVLASFAALRSRSEASITTASEEQQLRNLLGGDPAHRGPIGTADFSHAVPFPISGSSAHGWLVASGDKACLVLPDPVDGYGASCATPDEAKAGHGVLIMMPQDGSGPVTIATLVADGGSAPSVMTVNKSNASLAVTGNVAAAVLPSSDTVDTGNGSPIVFGQMVARAAG